MAWVLSPSNFENTHMVSPGLTPPLPACRYPCTLVAELCENGSLQTLLLKHKAHGTVIKWHDGIRYVSGIAAGMFYLHSRKPLAVMHRDLKPANCLIAADNEVRLTDFGLSKLLAVDKRRVEHMNPHKRDNAPMDLDASVHGQDTPVPLEDKTFHMTGETGAYKVRRRPHHPPPPLCSSRPSHQCSGRGSAPSNFRSESAFSLSSYPHADRPECFLCVSIAVSDRALFPSCHTNPPLLCLA